MLRTITNQTHITIVSDGITYSIQSEQVLDSQLILETLEKLKQALKPEPLSWVTTSSSTGSTGVLVGELSKEEIDKIREAAFSDTRKRYSKTMPFNPLTDQIPTGLSGKELEDFLKTHNLQNEKGEGKKSSGVTGIYKGLTVDLSGD